MDNMLKIKGIVADTVSKAIASAVKKKTGLDVTIKIQSLEVGIEGGKIQVGIEGAAEAQINDIVEKYLFQKENK